MKIIIVGCGRVGYTLAQQLTDEGHNVTMIDTSVERLQPALNNLDIQAVVGNGTSFATQGEAGVEDADLLIAVTDCDEVNLISCIIAKKEGNCRTIARVRSPQYFKELDYLKQCIGMSAVINPEFTAATDIAQLISIPDAVSIDSFARGRVDLIQIIIPENSEISGMTVRDFSRKLNHKVLICIQEHDGEITIPNGQSVLSAHDAISVILPTKFLGQFYKELHLGSLHEVNSIMIFGGGKTAYYLADKLLKDGKIVKIIEENDERAHFLSENLPNATIVHADATDHDALLEEGINKTDAAVFLLPEDEKNAFLSIYTSKVNPKCRRITRLERLNGSELLDDLSVGSIVSPRDITTEYIIQFVRSRMDSHGSSMEALYRLMDNRVEALEFIVDDTCPIVDIPLSKLSFKSNMLVAAIVRHGQIITPSGQDTMIIGDTVIIITTEKGVDEIADIVND